MKQKFWVPLAIAAALVAGLWGGMYLNRDKTETTPGQEKLLTVLQLINENYVDEIDIDSLVEMSLPLILENLDPHSSYLSGEALAMSNSELEGRFSGVGISFRILNDTLSVLEVIPGGPSEKAGLIAGDRILKVDGRDIASTPITEDEVFKMLRGETGSQVSLTVKRRGHQGLLQFNITRDEIPVESVESAYMLDDRTGYVKVTKFARNTYQEFRQALNKLRLQGARGFVVDLRGNGGGFMVPAVEMANEFLPGGRLIVSTKGRIPEEDETVVSDGSGAFQGYGLVVLIDEFSASASEIFSGAVQDNDRGWIIGRRSFGKGLVQKPITLSDSSEIRLTVQRYYTPSGRSIQKDYTRGDIADYSAEIINRYNNGELQSADSVKLNLDRRYSTMGGRTVYGGGGIMPDYFVPEDTSKVTSYYINIVNKDLMPAFAYEYCDLNRTDLNTARNVTQLLQKLPSDRVLLQAFVDYAAHHDVPARWYYINISSPLIVNRLKALIAQYTLGRAAFYEITNSMDNNIDEALRHIDKPVIQR